MNYFSLLDKHKYMNLATFRKSGEKMVTPVWFAQDGERVIMFTVATSGKAKRIRNNARVEVAPSDQRGKPLGDAVQAQAKFLQGKQAKQAIGLLKHKYGWQFSLFEWFGKARGSSEDNRAVIEITAP